MTINNLIAAVVAVPGIKAIKPKDYHYLLSCFFQAVSAWNQVIYAMNNRYLWNEEGAFKQVTTLPLKPEHYVVRVEQAYNYFATYHIRLGFDECMRIQNEITEILSKTY